MGGERIRRVFVGLLFLGIYAGGCASKPIVKETIDPQAQAAKRFEQFWNAAFNTALGFPLQDFSAADGYIESEWIYKTPQERYRFFIYVLRDTAHNLDIEIQSQTRPTQKQGWQWDAPSVDIEENLKKAIHGAVVNHPSS